MTEGQTELLRQVLRWLGVYLATVGLPEPLAALVSDPQTVSLVAAAISYGLADTGWLMKKIRGARK